MTFCYLFTLIFVCFRLWNKTNFESRRRALTFRPFLLLYSNQNDQEQSHKSYRPLTVATFKLNFALTGLQPFWFQFTNVWLNVAVCQLNYRFVLQHIFFFALWSFRCRVLFKFDRGELRFAFVRTNRKGLNQKRSEGEQMVLLAPALNEFQLAFSLPNRSVFPVTWPTKAGHSCFGVCAFVFLKLVFSARFSSFNISHTREHFIMFRATMIVAFDFICEWQTIRPKSDRNKTNHFDQMVGQVTPSVRLFPKAKAKDTLPYFNMIWTHRLFA